MIAKIEKIKNLAIFSRFAWDATLHPFKRYNLIYGWNGSGKTALSRLFHSINSGKHKDFPDLEYQVLIDGHRYTQHDKIDLKIRVFNSDYVVENVNVLDGEANAIYVLGEESKNILNEIRKDELTLNGKPGDEGALGKLELRRRAIEERDAITRRHDRIFTEIARTISAAWTTAGATRTYRRPDAKKKIRKLPQKKLLSEEKLTNCKLTLAQVAEPLLEPLQVQTVPHAKETFELQIAMTKLTLGTRDTLAQAVHRIAIDRLSRHKDISDWVEDGLKLHRSHKSSQCEFCAQPFPANRLDSLVDHFNEADQKLKREIDDLMKLASNITSAVDSISPYNVEKLYKQFREEYTASIVELETAKQALKMSINEIEASLISKRARTTEVLPFDLTLDSGAIEEAVAELNAIFEKHNRLSENYEAEQESARQAIEDHYLSSIYDDVGEIESDLERIKNDLQWLEHGHPDVEDDIGIIGLEQRIVANRARVSSAHKSCEQINAKLREFFGREEIAFEVKRDKSGTVGYQIVRGGKPAKHISEGEKTAVAFAYFCIHLTDRDFSLKDGVVVVDDPISSLDSALLFKVCAAIKTQMRSAAQLFVLTHNFEFFNHMKKWYLYDPAIRGKEGVSEPSSRFLMIHSSYEADVAQRVARIGDLDPMLRDYESEYHYLFKQLLDFSLENPGATAASIAAIYDYPTIARKVLECFLAYRVPKGGSFYVRMLGLKAVNREISGEDIEFVYNFVNSHSHLDTKSGLIQFDPTLPVSGPEAVKRTLQIIEQADQAHFAAMKKAAKAA